MMAVFHEKWSGHFSINALRGMLRTDRAHSDERHESEKLLSFRT